MDVEKILFVLKLFKIRDNIVKLYLWQLEAKEINKYNYVVVNDDLNDATKKVNEIIESQKCRVDRIEELDINSIEEAIHEELIDL